MYSYACNFCNYSTFDLTTDLVETGATEADADHLTALAVDVHELLAHGERRVD